MNLFYLYLNFIKNKNIDILDILNNYFIYDIIKYIMWLFWIFILFLLEALLLTFFFLQNIWKYKNRIINLKEENNKLIKENIQIKEKIKYQENFINNMHNTFMDLSNSTLNKQTDMFLGRINNFFSQINERHQQDKSNLKNILDPLLLSLKDFKEKTEVLEKDRITSNERIKESLMNLSQAQQELKNITFKMTSSSKMAGNWGEIQLKRLIEMAGLLPYCDFQEQVQFVTEDGILRPDMVISLPENTKIVIDAKTPLSSYIKMTNYANEEERKKFQREYYRGVKNHITNLGNKKYWEQFQNSPEMVIMFLPNEDFLFRVLEEDVNIIEHAYKLNVVICTPLTLIPLLKIIATTWSRFKFTEESEDIKNQTEFLYNSIFKILNILYDFGKDIEHFNKNFQKITNLEKEISGSLEEIRIKYFPSLPVLKSNEI
ncbi:hypothetical protein AB836_00455 [Rickettsiales bacterium (ex Bugula neritina AB1)]|nr:hypothetical protein AB836_00455 [Rickettsiales bacterium (ex Bugula neritina AB1)]